MNSLQINFPQRRAGLSLRHLFGLSPGQFLTNSRRECLSRLEGEIIHSRQINIQPRPILAIGLFGNDFWFFEDL